MATPGGGAASLTPGPQQDPHVYEQTLMYGRYTKDLGEFAREQAIRSKVADERRKERSEKLRFRKEGYFDKAKKQCSVYCGEFINKVGEDWLFLTLLGVTMALLSFIMDYAIDKCQEAYIWAYYALSFNAGLQYLLWIAFPLIFICFSTGFVHLVGPNAIGSGIPEMKTILRGVVLKEYLTFKTLIAKMVGLSASLGSGLLIGKEGPFVHVASITATLLGKAISHFRGIFENESRNSEMLAAACAVGVACTFAAPIGGVLFSIEVTSTYFAVRNYWRGFYSAVCGAFVFRLLAIFFQDEETLTALFQTNLRQDLPFDVIEMIAFALIGLVCGFAGALFVYTHRKVVDFIRNQKKMTVFLQKNRFIFPSVVVFILSSLLFPAGLGQYMAGEMSNRAACNEFFSNFTWTHAKPVNMKEEEILSHWTGPENNIYMTITLFILMRFWMTAVAITLPVPSGVFMPVFTIGAAFGRLVGEGMAAWFPEGIAGKAILPGGYAIVGAASLAGSVTHTISTSVIVFELTGHIGHVLPCVIAVIISNMVAHALQLSIYDSMIRIKQLPYLPDIINPQAVNAFGTTVEDFMNRNVKYLCLESTYMDIYDLLRRYKFRAYPLVDADDSMILLGSLQRFDLERLLILKLTDDDEDDIDLVDDDKYYESQFSEENIPVDNLSNPPDDPPPEATVDVSSPSPSKRFNVSRVVIEEPTEAEKPDFEAVEAPVPEPEIVIPSNDDADAQTDMSEILLNAESPVDTQKKDTREKFKKRKSISQKVRSIFKQDSSDSLDAAVELELNTLPFRIEDININELADWEMARMREKINFEPCHIDPAPFQLVERTSLYRVHSIFSLLSLNHAYVTNTGRLVGVVALKEVRMAIAGEMSGLVPKQPRHFFTSGRRPSKPPGNIRSIHENLAYDRTDGADVRRSSEA